VRKNTAIRKRLSDIFSGLLISMLILMSNAAFCEESRRESQNANAPEKWGIAMSIRSATIPFDAKKSVVNDIVPLIFYDNGRLFIDGLEFGYRLFQGKNWQLSPFARYRFFDIPEEYQNEIRESGLDPGGQFSYHFTDWFRMDVEVLSDQSGRFYANLTPGFEWERGAWEFRPYVRFRWKSADFNNRYYGLDREDRAAPWIRRSPRTFAFTCGETCTCWQGAVFSFLIPTPETSLLSTIPPRPRVFWGSGFSMTKKIRWTRWRRNPIFVWHTDGGPNPI
jgi:outer membrane scaffolding protein for murein synthesis (MipA/OmpV family)